MRGARSSGKQGLLNALWNGWASSPSRSSSSSTATLRPSLTLTGLLLPLAVLPIYSSMANVSRDHLEAARDLGSRGLHLLRTILLPMMLPGISTAFAFAFLLAAGDFVTPTLVGGTQGVMIGNVIADQFRGIGSNWPLGAALAFVVMARGAGGLLRRHAAPALGDDMVTGSGGRKRAGESVYVAAVLLFLFVPVAVIVLFSFTTSPRLSLPIEGLTLDWYARAFANPLTTVALRNSVLVAAVHRPRDRRARRRLRLRPREAEKPAPADRAPRSSTSCPPRCRCSSSASR